MTVYNLSLFSLFFIFTQFIISAFRTIYSFSQLTASAILVNSAAITLFSIAGIPPFVGFFSKLLILITLISSFFYFFFIFFFILLFFGLYFYLQNLRFLYSSVVNTLNYAYVYNLKHNSGFFLINNFYLFFFIFGFLLFDDIILYFYWILI